MKKVLWSVAVIVALAGAAGWFWFRRPADGAGGGCPCAGHGHRAAPAATTTASPAWVGGFQTIEAEREILVHCGTSMRPAAERLADAFQKEHGIAVRFNYGGSAELMATVELGPGGDLFICHDPYADRLAEKGQLNRAVTVGWLEPVLIVPPGNPKGIRSLADLARPGLRVGLPDARFATAGKLVRAALAEQGIEAAVQANVRMEARGHNELALALTAGQVDVAAAWNFIAAYYAGRLETVPPGVTFPETRVTVCLLNKAANGEAAELFMQAAAAPAGRAVFASMGYRRRGTAEPAP